MAAEVRGLDDREEIANRHTRRSNPCAHDARYFAGAWMSCGVIAKPAIDHAERQAATSHNLDEPLIRALRPADVIIGKLSHIAAR